MNYVDINKTNFYIHFMKPLRSAFSIRETMSHPLPHWLAELNEEDLNFVRRFVLASGSLKEMANGYSVSYPTVRARLDRLIAKIQASEASEPLDPVERKIRLLVADGKLAPATAKELLQVHRQSSRSKRTTTER